MTEFTPVASLVGGALIGLSAVLLMLWQGRIAGISLIASRLMPSYSDAPSCRASASCSGWWAHRLPSPP